MPVPFAFMQNQSSGPIIKPFTAEITTATAARTFNITVGSDNSDNVIVRWGDGTISTLKHSGEATASKTYSTNGTFTITIVGPVSRLRFGTIGTAARLNKVTHPGPYKFTNMLQMFYDCVNLTEANVNTEEAINMQQMFRGCTSFNADIGAWDVSKATNMTAMFENCTSFNQDLTGWCVSNFATQPPSFASGSNLAPGNYPVWGTCPA